MSKKDKKRHPPLGPMSPFEEDDEQKDTRITIGELSEHQQGYIKELC